MVGGEGGGWPRISIVIPSYRQGEFLAETLRSVILQGYPDLELIVIDGGSNDGTVEILKRYEPWIDHWTSEPDRGQSHAINKGFARATGEVVTFLGSDDLYAPGALRDVACRYLQHPRCGAVVGAFCFLDEPEGGLSERIPARLPDPGPHDLTLLDPAAWRLHQVSTFYSREALEAVGPRVVEDLHYTMDRELLYRVARRFPIVLSERVYGLFRRHPQAKSSASIVPMSREMGALHLRSGAEGGERTRRRRLARHHWARGEWKLARSGVGVRKAVPALLRTLLHRPDFALRRAYLLTWCEVLGVAQPLRRLRRALRRAGAPSQST